MKTTLTPFGIYVYRKMPLGLWNAPITFQRCLINMKLLEREMEVFIDDIIVFGATFNVCLKNLH